MKTRNDRNTPPLDIIYEDEWIIVIDKPSGLLTMSTGAEGEVTAYSLTRAYVEGRRPQDRRRGRYGRQEQGLFIVHRLDRDTSGLLIFAKDIRTKEILQEHWNELLLSRCYTAIVEGHPAQPEGTLKTYLFQDPISLRVWSSPKDNGGKLAITRYRTMKQNQDYTMLECELETGRKNQIRVQCEGMGCPVAGDRRYGAKTNPLGRLALHARRIVLIHPYENEEFEFSSKLPDVFRRIKF